MQDFGVWDEFYLRIIQWISILNFTHPQVGSKEEQTREANVERWKVERTPSVHL